MRFTCHVSCRRWFDVVVRVSKNYVTKLDVFNMFLHSERVFPFVLLLRIRVLLFKFRLEIKISFEILNLNK